MVRFLLGFITAFVVLVIGVLLISLVHKKLVERD